MQRVQRLLAPVLAQSPVRQLVWVRVPKLVLVRAAAV